jgi:transposase
MERPVLSEAVRAALPPEVQAYIAFLEADNARLAERVTTLEARLETLEARLRQYSGNSSQPPSQDPPSAPPRPAKPTTGHRRGAQPGHPGHQRELLPSDQVDAIVVHRPASCPHCGTPLPAEASPVGEVHRYQVWELPPVQPVVTEHQYPRLRCPACWQPVPPQTPAPSEASAFGPRTTAVVSLLHGRFRLSMRETAAVLRDLCGIPMAVGSVPAACAETAAALALPYAAVASAVRGSAHINVDETGWRQAGARRWLWVVVGVLGTLFLVAAHRSRAVFETLVGEEFAGIVGSDRYSAYAHVPLARRQLCWAHLKRNLAAFAAWGGAVGPWGKEAETLVGELFTTWHRFRTGALDRTGLAAAMQPHQAALRTLLERGCDLSPPRALCQELLAHWPALWTFVTVAGVEPTNNAAEQALRPAVLWRKGCFGANSDAGNVFVARILTVAATCRQQHHDLLRFLTDAITAPRAGLPAPTLIGRVSASEQPVAPVPPFGTTTSMARLSTAPSPCLARTA